MKRVAIVGDGAGGKTMLAHALSERLHVPALQNPRAERG